MNSPLRTSLVLLPLLALIGGLWWLAPQPSEPGYQTTIGILRRVALRQARLDRNILRAHDGLSRDYDPINTDIAEMRQAVVRLGADAASHAWDRTALVTLHTTVNREEAAVERFKTDNALVTNSLAYVEQASASLMSSGADLRTAFLVSQFANLVLHLVRTPTPNSAELIRAALSEVNASLAEQQVPADLGAAVVTLRQHASLLAETIPAVDAELEAVFANSTNREIASMREATVKRHEAEERTATRFELAILPTTAVLLALAVRLGLSLRALLQRQRRHAVLERAIAQVSTDLIAQPTGSGGKVWAVAKLGEAFDADRVLLTLQEPPTARWHWSKTGGMTDEDWSDTIRALDDADALPTDGILRIPDLSKLPDGALRNALQHAGVVACIGVLLLREGRPCGWFLLQRTQARAAWVPDEGLVRMAADVVGNAVRRLIEERRRADLEERLVRVRRLEAVGVFASGIAHNFNNVIGAVLGHAEMAEDGLPNGVAAFHHVQEIRRAGERAQDLVGRILEFGTRRRPNRDFIEIDVFVARTTSLLSGSLAAGSLVALPGAPGCVVDADTVQLQQVVINLVRNGVQASAADTPVTIRTSCERVLDARPLSYGLLTPGRWICLMVEDRGAGMNAAVQRQMFDPFFTTRPAGTGLGLATTIEIVRDHGGLLNVTSGPGHGTAIAVWLPLARAQAEQSAVARPGSGQTILVLAADDVTVQRDEEMLAALGYEPVGFTNFDAMLALLAAVPDRFDAMLLGTELLADVRALQEISRLAPGSPIILALGATANAASAPRLHAATVLHRPLRSSSLATALASCLRKPGSVALDGQGEDVADPTLGDDHPGLARITLQLAP